MCPLLRERCIRNCIRWPRLHMGPSSALYSPSLPLPIANGAFRLRPLGDMAAGAPKPKPTPKPTPKPLPPDGDLLTKTSYIVPGGAFLPNDTAGFRAAGVLLYRQVASGSVDVLVGFSRKHDGALTFLGGKRELLDDQHTWEQPADTACKEFHEETGHVLTTETIHSLKESFLELSLSSPSTSLPSLPTTLPTPIPTPSTSPSSPTKSPSPPSSSLSSQSTTAHHVIHACWMAHGKYALYLVPVTAVRGGGAFEADVQTIPSRFQTFLSSEQASLPISTHLREMVKVDWISLDHLLRHEPKTNFARQCLQDPVLQQWVKTLGGRRDRPRHHHRRETSTHSRVSISSTSDESSRSSSMRRLSSMASAHVPLVVSRSFSSSSSTAAVVPTQESAIPRPAAAPGLLAVATERKRASPSLPSSPPAPYTTAPPTTTGNATAPATATPLPSAVYHGISHVNWFPGHMAKALVAVQEKLKDVQVVIEVRDCRIPFASANQDLESLIKDKKRIIVFNKADLCGKGDIEAIRAFWRKVTSEHRGHNVPVISFCQGNDSNRVRDLLRTVVETVPKTFRTVPSSVLICGYPNVGKSSIINSLKKVSGAATAARIKSGGKKKKGLAKTGATPGLTRHLDAFQVSDEPPVVVIDSPGIMAPYFERTSEGITMGLKLALTGSIKDHLIGEEVLGGFLLFLLNTTRHFEYVTVLQLKDKVPTTDLHVVMAAIAERNGWIKASEHATATGTKTRTRDSLDALSEQDCSRACRIFVRMYREGRLGKFCLDTIPGITSNEAASSPTTG